MDQIATNIAGAEGPIFDRDGYLCCVEPPSGRVLRLKDHGLSEIVADTHGMPAGLAIDRAGDLWVADMERGILRIDEHGQVHHEIACYDDQPIRGCNDLVFDRRGHLYFTAPAGSDGDTPVGEFFVRYASGCVKRLDAGFQFCNGVAVSPDDGTLIVAETFTKILFAYNLSDDGEALSPRTPFAKLPGQHRGGPDGLDYDVEGLLLAANWGGGSIDVFDPDGRCVERIKTPFDKPSNLHFGGHDGRDLIITEHTNNAVWRTRWRNPGYLASSSGF